MGRELHSQHRFRVFSLSGRTDPSNVALSMSLELRVCNCLPDGCCFRLGSPLPASQNSVSKSSWDSNVNVMRLRGECLPGALPFY